MVKSPKVAEEGGGLVPGDVREYDIYGCLFKRRGGTVGKFLGWKPRLITLHQGRRCHMST
jgi:hypothetical protein